MLKKLITNSLMMVMILSMGISVNASEEKLNFNNYEVENSTETRYVEHLAEELGVPIEEAYEINEKENQELLMKNTGKLRRADEVVKYKTIRSSQKIINTNNKLHMAAEVKYLYSNVDERAVEIIKVGEPYMYVSGATTLRVNGGNFNVENNGTSARISRTCSLTYEVTSSVGISVGGDILGVNKTESETYMITTDAITIAMNIRLRDF